MTPDVASLDPDELLDRLLALWRETRLGELREAIRLVSNQCGEPIASTPAAFYEALRSGPVAVGRALAAYPIGTDADADAQIEAIEGLPDDPRISDLHFRREDADRRADLTERCQDEDQRPLPPDSYWTDSSEWAPASPEVDVSGRPQAFEILVRVRGRFETDAVAEEMLLAVLQDPGDDELRRVYADRLMSIGDPRGELIEVQYQLLEDQTVPLMKREAQLLLHHRTRFVGGLRPALDVPTTRFERGFLDACRLSGTHQYEDLRRTIAHPMWRTVRELRVSNTYGLEDLVCHEVLRGLRALTGAVPTPVVAALANSPPRMLERLAVAPAVEFAGSTARIESEVVDALTDPPGLPRLEALEITTQLHHIPLTSMRWLFDSPVGRRLREVRVATRIAQLLEWRAALPSLRRVAIGEDPDELVLTVRSDGFAVAGIATHEDTVSQIAEVMKELEVAADRVVAFDLHWKRPPPAPANALREIRRSCTRLGVTARLLNC